MAGPSFTAHLLEGRKGAVFSAADDEAQMWLSGTMYSAGADTTSAALVRFILAMTLHPEIQQKAQEEIDRVVGTGRLPTLAECVDQYLRSLQLFH